MATLKEDVKDVSISLAYDLMLVALIFSWITAIVLALLEISLWLVFGFFLIGCGLFFAVIYVGQKYKENEEKEVKEEVNTSEQATKIEDQKEKVENKGY
ncbi:MAG TPA: hypothetical protein VMZ29_07245 [Candidatus Bathyarchaeia archaeon]|nr:hypothetical protein [Candidatus Bathyarchaeia archaeon]